MNSTPDKAARKRPSKGMRKHNRKVKQEARRVNIPTANTNKRNHPG